VVWKSTVCDAGCSSVVCRLVCFRDKKLSSDVYDKSDEGDEEQADAVAAAVQVQSSSDVDGQPLRNPVTAADVDAVRPGTRRVCLKKFRL